MARDNDYLIARQDGAIIDAQPWGVGPGPPGTPWPHLPEPGTTPTPTRTQWIANPVEQRELQRQQWEDLTTVCEVQMCVCEVQMYVCEV